MAPAGLGSLVALRYRKRLVPIIIKRLELDLQFFVTKRPVAKPTYGQGFSRHGYNPKQGERTLEAYDKYRTSLGRIKAGKWINPDGSTIWPTNMGFKGKPRNITLKSGTKVDRFGYEGGTFVSPRGTPYANRSLAPGTELKPYNIYEIIKPVKVKGGKIAPWFDQPGGGIQYEFSCSIKELIDAGILRRVIR